MVAGLNDLQPGAQRGLRAVQELTHTETREDLQSEVSQRSAEDHTKDWVSAQHGEGTKCSPILYPVILCSVLFASSRHLCYPFLLHHALNGLFYTLHNFMS